MPMNQKELKEWAAKQEKKLKREKYEQCALMNFRSYLGGMTNGLEDSAVQLLWARSLAYDLYSKLKKDNNMLGGGLYKSEVTYYYVESDDPQEKAPTVTKDKTSGAKEVTFTGAGQCAWFMDQIGNALVPMAKLKEGELAVLGAYNKDWKHNFVVLAPDETTIAANEVVVFDAWALAFGVPVEQCWGVKADKSWLARKWSSTKIERVYK